MEEMFDVLNKDGESLGIQKSKGQVHIDGDWHRAAHVWFINGEGELLIQRRSEAVLNHPDMWSISAAGHIPAGEDSKTSALREVEEEISIHLDGDELKFLGSVAKQLVSNEGTYVDNEHDDIYLVEMEIDPGALDLQKGEVAEVRLIPWRELRVWVNENRKDVVPYPAEYKLLFDYLEKKYK